MAIGRVLVAVACALMLTAPSTAAAPSQDRPGRATMTMAYEVGDLAAVVHAPRTLVDVGPLVFGNDLTAPLLAQQGAIVVVVHDRWSVDRHRELWRALDERSGPLAERFAGFAGHFTVVQP
ncbi:hypothetical protein [Lentzea albida]|uniref:Uncharacterized protein n=1 Tax=Lentzea albida TaxID=65499 RepID=A0A1H9F3I7_9PSEU|nr:hypothetical protein [Lentzea albida]SEQ31778.1 hypothetical protein SAMN04488000_102501 [Lentzea albida]